jgi:hypothetical protein
MRFVSLIFVVASAGWAAADGVVKIESPPKSKWVEIAADPGITTLSVAGDKPAKWVLVDDGADLRPAADGRTASFAAGGEGEYRLVVVAGDEVHRIKLTKGKPVDPPNPNPKPPAPPAPVDPLAKVLQAGYDADPRAADAKRDDLLDLIELYRQAATLADDPAVDTAEAMVGRVRSTWEKIQKDKGVKDGLLAVRKAIGGELATAFPENVNLDKAGRKKAGEAFARIRGCLEQVK